MQYGKHKKGTQRNAARLNAVMRTPAFLHGGGFKKIG